MQSLTALADTHATASPDTSQKPAVAVLAHEIAQQAVHQHVAGVFRFARTIGADRELAADLTQEAFTIALQKAKLDLPQQALASFLRRTVRNLWLQQHRSERRKEAAITAWSERLHVAEQVGDRNARIEATRECVDNLKGRAQSAVQLCYGQGLSREQIAEALDMTPNGVKTLLARTRRWLEQCLQRANS